MTEPTKVAVVGVGRFGRQHARVYSEMPQAQLVGVYDLESAHVAEVAAEYHCKAFARLEDLLGEVDAASVAVPTPLHAEFGQQLMRAGIDVLIEKPMARTVAEAEALLACSGSTGRVLQVGHLERFNPAVQAARKIVSRPLFFEVHRMSVFSPRSLEVDVVLDLMIHDLDIVLSLVDSSPEEIRGVGLPVLSRNIDIANVRICFQNGCVANFTASRVSTETIRKLRWFQPHEYVSVDYARQEAAVTSVDLSTGRPSLSYRRLEIAHEEPLRLQLRDFLTNVQQRNIPVVGGKEGQRALMLAHQILGEITRHSERLKGHAELLAWQSRRTDEIAHAIPRPEELS
ncbi:MAG: Gfo/Idh/MocA family oxidoreductase [Acidobacteria bacterium]|nr:Gfo/Idh/MocA family oxidoreductase [Acidobacteriota bacterium]